MHFDSWSAFWNMGGYGLYVWLSFGGTFLTLAFLVAESLLAKRHLLVQIKVEQDRKQRITAAKQANTHLSSNVQGS